MIWHSFQDFFEQATGKKPFPYQSWLATEADLPELLEIPTGAGKTAAAILAWLWRRRFHDDEAIRRGTPRRLVYCLPMRVLVEQVKRDAEEYMGKLKLLESDDRIAKVFVHSLMGGDVDLGGFKNPDAEVVFIGTQDMLLSGALNRGYGMSRFQWPIAFGLLNNDSLWVLDEVQLMGSGLSTTVQLAAFRERFTVFGRSPTIWMSATLQPEWLETVDHGKSLKPKLVLSDEDKGNEELARRLTAVKTLRQCPGTVATKDKGYALSIAQTISEKHQDSSLTLLVMNTVERAKETYHALKNIYQKKGGSEAAKPELLLIHSRFRPPERLQRNEKLTEKLSKNSPGRVIVATQVIEAGVNISAHTLFTELAPWASLVQRFGRCNRFGEHREAFVYWSDLDEKHAPPYEFEELNKSRNQLQAIEGRSVAPDKLPMVSLTYEPRHVIRAKDLVELFDTAPDLSGNDIDVSRFIRDDDELDVQVFWRDWDKKKGPAPDFSRPCRDELCSVPIGEIKGFLKEKLAYRWDNLDEKWVQVGRDDIFPGQVLLLHADDGGYSEEIGWDQKSKERVNPVTVLDNQPPESTRSDNATYEPNIWLSLAGHTDDVVNEMKKLLGGLDELGLSGWVNSLNIAARWHDAGKAHPVFQNTLLGGLGHEERAKKEATIWAKSANKGQHHERPHFRHELASAVALLKSADDDLATFLVAAHHGKVRLSIRALPGEKAPATGRRYSFGIWEGDQLRQVDLGGGVICPAQELSLEIMELGLSQNNRPSWLERMLALRDSLGPFRLTFLEALLRTADARASAAPGKEELVNA